MKQNSFVQEERPVVLSKDPCKSRAVCLQCEGCKRKHMKTATANPEVSPAPAKIDFTDRPQGLSLDQSTAVAGYGKVVIRPIRLEDEDEMIRFHKDLSEESIYLRYFEYLGLDRRASHERLVRICTNTPESCALVIEQQPAGHRVAEILAVGRLTIDEEPLVVNFDTLITQEEKGPRLGRVILNSLLGMARAYGFKILKGDLLAIDHETLSLCRSLGFTLKTISQGNLVEVRLDL